MPTVSVIIPAYNAARTVGMAVDSVLAQTHEDLEVLVVDDGSRDDTAREVGAREDPRLRCLTSENGGVSAARNRGLRETSAEWVAFLDADDAWRPTKLARQLEAVSGLGSSGLCFTSTTIVDDDMRPTGSLAARPSADFTRALLETGNVIAGSASSVLARRSVIDQAGEFDVSMSQCADWDMWLRLSLLTTCVPVSDELVLYRRVAGTMSSNPALLERDTFALLDKFYATSGSEPYRAIRRRVYANHWMICAGTYLHAGRTRDSLRCVANGLRSDIRTAGRPLSAPGRWIERALRRSTDPA